MKNKNTQENLLKNGWHYLDEKYVYLIKACLNFVEKEMGRKYWNRFQKMMTSPFENTGERFESNGLVVRAYDWSEPDEPLPNFETEQLKVWWYKHSNRGVLAMVKCTDGELADMLASVITESLLAMDDKLWMTNCE